MKFDLFNLRKFLEVELLLVRFIDEEIEGSRGSK